MRLVYINMGRGLPTSRFDFSMATAWPPTCSTACRVPPRSSDPPTVRRWRWAIVAFWRPRGNGTSCDDV